VVGEAGAVFGAARQAVMKKPRARIVEDVECIVLAIFCFRVSK
jgi:hypothetical protein